MILNQSDYNPLHSIMANAKRGGGRLEYNQAFYDFVRRELFSGGVVFETEEEFTEALALLLNMDII